MYPSLSEPKENSLAMLLSGNITFKRLFVFLFWLFEFPFITLSIAHLISAFITSEEAIVSSNVCCVPFFSVVCEVLGVSLSCVSVCLVLPKKHVTFFQMSLCLFPPACLLRACTPILDKENVF